MNFFWVLIIILKLAHHHNVIGGVGNPRIDEETPVDLDGDAESGDPSIEPDDDEVDKSDMGTQLRKDGTVSAWPQGEVFYEIQEKGFNKGQLKLISQAMCLIEVASCIRFLPKEDDTEYYISLQSATGCNTEVGRQPQPGPHIVHLSTKICFARVGQISHELFHALGFYHEIMRNDRDKYVKVNFQNLKDPKSARQFNIKDPIAANYEGPFDFESIMLYNRNEYAVKGKTTFDPLPNATVPKGVHIGQRSKLSDGDIAKLNKFYECDYISPKESSCT